MRLNTTVMTPVKITNPSTRDRSGSLSAFRKAGPRPGQEKIDSVTTAPPSSAERLSAQRVTIGMSALRRACRHTTRRSLRPLARAVRM